MSAAPNDPQPRRVWAISRAGALGNLALEDDELPPPPPGHLRVRVCAVGLNFADIFAILGVYSATPKNKFVPGLEFAGHVEAVGVSKDVGKDEVDNERSRWLGRRVFGCTRFGGYATYVNADARYCRHTPDNWSDAQASAFLAQGMTAYYALRELGGMAFHPTSNVASSSAPPPSSRFPKTVLVHSAAGGVGLLALSILARSPTPVRVLGTVGAAPKLDLLRTRFGNNGRFAFIQRGSAATFEARARDALRKLGGNGAEEDVGCDVVLDSIMGEYFWPNYNLMKRGGRLIVFGAADLTPTADLRPTWDAWSWAKLAWQYIWRPRADPMKMITANKSILGFNLIHIYEHEPMLRALWDELVALNLEPPLVGHELPFERAHDAIRLLQSGETVGKVVLNV